jgi:hypothetical protein
LQTFNGKGEQDGAWWYKKRSSRANEGMFVGFVDSIVEV